MLAILHRLLSEHRHRCVVPNQRTALKTNWTFITALCKGGSEQVANCAMFTASFSHVFNVTMPRWNFGNLPEPIDGLLSYEQSIVPLTARLFKRSWCQAPLVVFLPSVWSGHPSNYIPLSNLDRQSRHYSVSLGLTQ